MKQSIQTHWIQSEKALPPGSCAQGVGGKCEELSEGNPLIKELQARSAKNRIRFFALHRSSPRVPSCPPGAAQLLGLTATPGTLCRRGCGAVRRPAAAAAPSPVMRSTGEKCAPSKHVQLNTVCYIGTVCFSEAKVRMTCGARDLLDPDSSNFHDLARNERNRRNFKFIESIGIFLTVGSLKKRDGNDQ